LAAATKSTPCFGYVGPGRHGCDKHQDQQFVEQARNAKNAADQTRSSAIRSATRQNIRTSSAVKNNSGALVLLLAICLPKIDLLSRPEDGALPGRYI
jgi:hypothetical protein